MWKSGFIHTLYLQLTYTFRIIKKCIYKIYQVEFDFKEVWDCEQSVCVKVTKSCKRDFKEKKKKKKFDVLNEVTHLCL